MKERVKYGQRAVAQEGKAKRRSNQEIMVVTYVFLALFLGMIAFLSYFMYKKADTYANNAYNAKRQTILAERYIRGDILAADGTVLAKTVVDEDGNETREYPHGRLYAHVVGYTGRGNSGIEQTENSSLLSSHNNPVDVVTNELLERKNQGDVVVTTLIPRVQEAAYEALDDRRGAVVVMEAASGKILAMVSKPDFNPNHIAKDWEEINSPERSGEAVLVNRASQGLYPPGSTFKMVTLLEYLREDPTGAASYTYDCEGVYSFKDYAIRCAHGNEHGKQSLEEAFANSCNGAFVKIGQTLSFSSVYRLCGDLGFNTSLPTAFSSSKSRFTLNSNADEWAVMLTSIGQGETLVTPLHLALIMSAMANEGKVMQPYVVDYVRSSEGTLVRSNSPSRWRQMISPAEANQLLGYLRRAVTDGTGSEAQGKGYTVWGKTGTAEYNSKGDSHAWFVGCAGEDHPEVVVSVIVEGGESGGDVAAPICRKVLNAYYKQ